MDRSLKRRLSGPRAGAGPDEAFGPEANPAEPEVVRVYRLEDDLGYGPVARSKVKTSPHALEIERLLRDLRLPPWLRVFFGHQSPASGSTLRQDWAFGTVSLAAIRDYRRSWLGKGCALSVYAVPRPLMVEGDSEVLFWRGDLHGAGEGSTGRRHPSGLAPERRGRIAETDLVRMLDSEYGCAGGSV